MKKITLVLTACIFALTMNAQQTFEISNWQQGVTQGDASFTVELGDSVMWTWANGSPHTVTSEAGSVETFDSGILTGVGETFTYTFTVEGANPYLCTIHPAMTGVITAEAVLSVQDKFERNIKFLPNPVKDEMVIASLFQFDTYEIYNMSGQKVGSGVGEGTFTNLSTSYLSAGMYFVKVTAGELQATVKIMKE